MAFTSGFYVCQRKPTLVKTELKIFKAVLARSSLFILLPTLHLTGERLDYVKSNIQCSQSSASSTIRVSEACVLDCWDLQPFGSVLEGKRGVLPTLKKPEKQLPL